LKIDLQLLIPSKKQKLLHPKTSHLKQWFSTFFMQQPILQLNLTNLMTP